MDMNGGKKTFILDKKDGVTKGFAQHELLTRIPEMLRLQARRENIYYTPLSDDKHHILIDDMTVESVTRLKKDGFVPAVILESSPQNYQCILTIPKVDSPFTREASNRPLCKGQNGSTRNTQNCLAVASRPLFILGTLLLRISSPNIGTPTALIRA